MTEIEAVLDGFVEGLFRLMLDHHHAQVGEMDLTLVQAQALRLLRPDPLSTSKLAAALGISAPAVTQLTNRLNRKRLIERRTAKNDRRAVIVAVTEKGEWVVDGFRRGRNEIFAHTLSRLSDDDRAEVLAALSKVASVLRGGDASMPAREAPQPGRTAVRASEASNERGQAPVSRPTIRRMRIEWD